MDNMKGEKTKRKVIRGKERSQTKADYILCDVIYLQF